MAKQRGKRPEARPAAETPAPDAALWPLLLAGALVLAFYGALRIGVELPWGYDDYYHLGVARELGRDFPLRAFPWTPFSVLAERYADKEFLFHILLIPLAGLPAVTAAWIGAMLGQAFLIGSTAWFLRSQRVPGAAALLLGLAGLGPFFALRIEQLRPHVWMLGFCALVLGLLFRNARPWVLAMVCAIFGLTHTAGWVAIPFAVIWSLASRFAPASASASDRRLRFAPVLAAAGGWLLGQLVHPNLPHNFWLFWTQNVVVPLASVGAETRSLREAVGIELQAPGLTFLLEQWPVFIASVFALVQLVRRPAARTPSALTLVALSVAFLLVGSLSLRRMLEVGAVLGILALASVVTDSRYGRAAAALALLGAAWTVWQVRDFGRGDLRPLGNGQPLAMARFLGENGRPGDLVFTAQWADSAPLFYAAPRLKSLVALDPTFFYAKDPQLFDRYWAIAHGRSGDPVGEIQRRFRARYVTIWKAPAFRQLAMQLRRDPDRAWLLYQDRAYEVWELASGG